LLIRLLTLFISYWLSYLCVLLVWWFKFYLWWCIVAIAY